MASSKVQLYIYDLSGGMAAQLSSLFLGELAASIRVDKYPAFQNNCILSVNVCVGKQINGIW